MPTKLPESKRQTHRIIALVTRAEHEKHSAAAAAVGLSIGEYTRRKLNDEPLPEKRKR